LWGKDPNGIQHDYAGQRIIKHEQHVGKKPKWHQNKMSYGSNATARVPVESHSDIEMIEYKFENQQ
jgi:hypothetical protein